MSRITSGLMLPLTTADLLANAIIGSVLENLDMESIVQRELLALSRDVGFDTLSGMQRSVSRSLIG